MKRPANVMYLALPAALGVAGCSYSPGHDYGVVASWLLNGAEPSKERCAELAVATIRLTMDGPGDPVTVEAPCEQRMILSDGLAYGAFETTTSFDFDVGYTYEVEFLDKKGKARSRHEATLVAYYGEYTPVELDTVDLIDPVGSQAAITAAWVFAGGSSASVAVDCASNGIEKVALWITSVTDPFFASAYVIDETACMEGSFASATEVLATGDYLIKYVALDDRGAIAEEGEAINVYVDQPSTVDLPRQTFEGI